ncbi:MAG: hypothetical protein ACM3P0_14310 [Acidobacteriota bacterium]
MKIIVKGKHVLLLLILISITLSNTNCKSSDDGPLEAKVIHKAESSSHLLFPASVGSQWLYDRYMVEHFVNYNRDWNYKSFGSFGINLDTLKIAPILTKREITDSINITLNDTTYSCVLLNNGLKVPYFVGSDGVYNMGIYPDNGDPILKKGLYLPQSIPLNMPWNGQISYVQEGKYKVDEVFDRRCIAFNEAVSTPAGNFNCYVIRTRIREAEDYPGYAEFYDYYAPQIGLVMKVYIFNLPNTYWSMRHFSVLKSYHLPEGAIK